MSILVIAEHDNAALKSATLHTIAAALNREGFRTPKLTRWTPPSVAAAINDLN